MDLGSDVDGAQKEKKILRGQVRLEASIRQKRRSLGYASSEREPERLNPQLLKRDQTMTGEAKEGRANLRNARSVSRTSGQWPDMDVRQTS